MSNETLGINSFLIVEDGRSFESNETPNIPVYSSYEGVRNELIPNN